MPARYEVPIINELPAPFVSGKMWASLRVSEYHNLGIRAQRTTYKTDAIARATALFMARGVHCILRQQKRAEVKMRSEEHTFTLTSHYARKEQEEEDNTSQEFIKFMQDKFLDQSATCFEWYDLDVCAEKEEGAPVLGWDGVGTGRSAFDWLAGACGDNAMLNASSVQNMLSSLTENGSWPQRRKSVRKLLDELVKKAKIMRCYQSKRDDPEVWMHFDIRYMMVVEGVNRFWDTLKSFEAEPSTQQLITSFFATCRLPFRDDVVVADD